MAVYSGREVDLACVGIGMDSRSLGVLDAGEDFWVGARQTKMDERSSGVVLSIVSAVLALYSSRDLPQKPNWRSRVPGGAPGTLTMAAKTCRFCGKPGYHTKDCHTKQKRHVTLRSNYWLTDPTS